MTWSIRWTGRLLMMTALSSGPAMAATAVQTPVELRGVWFEDSSQGEHLCRQHRVRRSVDLVPGTLEVSDRQIAEARAGVQADILFLTRVVQLADEAWQIQGLLDVYPYEQIKTLRSYGYTVRESRLLRSRSLVKDGHEVLETQSYSRCL